MLELILFVLVLGFGATWFMLGVIRNEIRVAIDQAIAAHDGSEKK